MKRRSVTLVLSAALVMGLLSGCSSSSSDETAAEETAEETKEEAGEEETAAEEEGEEAESKAADEEEAEEEEAEGAKEETEREDTGEDVAGIEYDGTKIRVGSLTGPTTMGIVNLMNASDNQEAKGNYTFTIGADVSEVVALVSTGDLDIAMIPANSAANLYNKTGGGVTVIDINTLGVLYCVSGDETIASVEDLAGRTVMSTGQGATPEYCLSYLLDAYGVEDVTVNFYSDQTEIAAYLQEDPTQIAILPQPFVTSAKMQNEALNVAFSLTEAWDAVADNDSTLVTGATVVRTEFLEEHPDAVEVFLEEHAASAEAAADDVEGTAELVVQYGILSSTSIAAAALPECNIVCIAGDEMVTALTGYLEVLYHADPTSVGGDLPEEDFYYTGE